MSAVFTLGEAFMIIHGRQSQLSRGTKSQIAPVDFLPSRLALDEDDHNQSQEELIAHEE